MWICPVCNTQPPNPVNKKCVNGHALWNSHIMGPTREQPFGAAFGTAFVVAILIALAVVAASRFRPDIIGPGILFLVPVALAGCGLDGLWHGAAWNRKGNPARRLAPRAFGMGCGCLAAAVAAYLIGGMLPHA